MAIVVASVAISPQPCPAAVPVHASQSAAATVSAFRSGFAAPVAVAFDLVFMFA